MTQAQTVPLYVDSGVSSNTIVPNCFNGTCAASAPEAWSVSALFQVAYAGTTSVALIGDYSCRTTRLGCNYSITTIAPASTGVVTAVPVLLSSFAVYRDPVTGIQWLDAAHTIPLTYDVYGNPIDPSTATYNADGTVATAGTAYVSCVNCSNLEFNPPYQMPCISDGSTVNAVDCQSNPDPNIYYGPPITGWVHFCAAPTATNPDGSTVEQFQACATTWPGGNFQVQHTPYDSPAFSAGVPVLDPGTGNPIALNCTNASGYRGNPYPVCVWSGNLPMGSYLLVGAGTSETIFRGAAHAGSSGLGYPVTVPSAPAAPPSPPPACPPTCGDD